MAVLRYLAVVVLSVWVSGLAVLSLTAPVLFATLQAHDPAAGRRCAGLAFGAVFRNFQTAAWICGGGAGGAAGTCRARTAPPPAGRENLDAGSRDYHQRPTAVVIVPEIDRLREGTGSIARCSDGSPIRTKFNWLQPLQRPDAGHHGRRSRLVVRIDRHALAKASAIVPER